MQTTAYASNGDRDGLKTGMDWAISSQATQKWAEGSTTRSHGPARTMKAHECGVQRCRGAVFNLYSRFQPLEIAQMADKKFFITEDELQAAYDELGSALEVAKKYDVSKKLVLNYIKRFGIQKHTRRMISGSVGDVIRRMASDNATMSEIVEATGFTATAIRNFAKRHGVIIVDPTKPGYVTTWAGYRKLLRPDHPRADSKGYVAEHTLVMEAHIGRFLEPDEVVHHINYDKADNQLDNLQLMTDAEHRALHRKAGDCGRSASCKDIV